GVVSLPAHALRELGGFQEAFEDRAVAELGIRHLEAGGRVMFSPAAGGIRREDRGLTGRLARRQREGKADVRLAARYPELWHGIRLSRPGTERRARRVLRSVALNAPSFARVLLRFGQASLARLERRQAWARAKRRLDDLDYFAYWIGIARDLGGGTAASRRLRGLTAHGGAAQERDLRR